MGLAPSYEEPGELALALSLSLSFLSLPLSLSSLPCEDTTDREPSGALAVDPQLPEP